MRKRVQQHVGAGVSTCRAKGLVGARPSIRRMERRFSISAATSSKPTGVGGVASDAGSAGMGGVPGAEEEAV